MGGGGEQTTVSKSEMPEWAQGYAQTYLDRANEVAQRPYEAYPWQRIADTSQDTLLGQDMLRNMGKGGFGYEANSAVMDTAKGVQGYNPLQVSAPTIEGLPTVKAGQLATTDLNPYLNPYTDEVTHRGVDELMRSAGILKSQGRTGAAGAYASGSARAALLEAEADRNAMDRAGNLAATYGERGFVNAQQAAAGDIDRTLRADVTNQDVEFRRQATNAGNSLTAQTANQSALQAAQGIRMAGANLLTAATDKQRDYWTQDAKTLMGVGGMTEAKDQAALDLAYKDWARQVGYPAEQNNQAINALAALIGGQGTKTATGPGQDNTGQLVGSGMMAAATVAAAMM